MNGFVSSGMGLVMFLLALGGSPPAAAQQWSTTDWQIAGVSNQGELSEQAQSHLEAKFDWLEDELGRSSQWMQGLGFKGPKYQFNSVLGKYRAYYDADYGVGNQCGQALANYNEANAHIELGPGIFQTGSGNPQAPKGLRDGDITYDEGYMLSPVHELFHAVQYGYVGASLNNTLWIQEGTAEAVRHAWAHKAYGGSGLRPRDYDYPLHRPRQGTGCGAAIEAYDTAHFWYHLGADIGSPDRVAYLDDVFAALADNFNSSRGGLAAVDEALAKQGGLDELYPQFIARHTRGAKADRFFESVRNVSLAGAYDRASPQAVVPPVASHAYHVKVKADEGDEPLGLRIALAKEHPDLHLIVDGQRHDTAAGPDERRNAFHVNLDSGEQQSYFVRVANVSDNAAESKKRRYTLKLSLGEPPAACSPEGMMTTLNADGFVPATGLLFEPDLILVPGAAAGSSMPTSPRGVKGFPSLPQAQGASDLPQPPGAEQIAPGSGQLTINGLVTAGGTGCTGHVLSAQALGSKLGGAETVGEVKNKAAELKRKAQELKKQYGGLSEKQFRDMSPQQRQALMRKMRQLSGSAEEDNNGPGDVAVRIFSPNPLAWQRNFLAPPANTVSNRRGDAFALKHGGYGGWQDNEASNLVLHLKGTPPGALREGGTYEAVASIPAGGGEAVRKSPGEVLTPSPLYTRWEGRFRPVHYVPLSPEPKAEAERARAEDKRECRQKKQRAKQRLQQKKQKHPDRLLSTRPIEKRNCDYKGTAFEGTTRALYGRLTGTVSIEEITGAQVRGRFQLEGDGALVATNYSFTYETTRSGQRYRTGSEETETTRRGPIKIQGSFSAPNLAEGLAIKLGDLPTEMETAVVE